MVTVRAAEREELEALLAFEREYVGTDATIDDYVGRHAAVPATFLVAEDPDAEPAPDGPQDPPWGRSVVGVASGAPGDPVEVAGIGVREDRRGGGIGRRLLAAFEERAAEYGSAVSAAAADNVEGFYLSAGYMPAKVLLQVPEGSLPTDYERRVPLLDERSPEPGWRFLYAGFDEYEPRVREGLRRAVGAAEANTIFEKPV
jgi:GNAT superfamily N-acetyltransferase